MISGIGSPVLVAEAFRSGASDFLPKPLDHSDLLQAIEKLIPRRSVSPARSNDPLPPSQRLVFLSSSPEMRRLTAAIELVAASDVPVVLHGESGVGKEVLARHLHERSRRAGKPFLKLNCAALPSELLESELFGYERGAFTGAIKNKPGTFELANGGTLLLDEIGDMDIRLQAKLLHVLQDQEFQRLGAKETVRVDVRVLAATHCNLEQCIREGRFRQDLYYRLNVITMRVPPLRQRRDEILPLAEFFLCKHGPASALSLLTPFLRQALVAHNWPGNIRELENTMRRLLVLRDPEALATELLEQSGQQPPQPLPHAALPPSEATGGPGQAPSILVHARDAEKKAEAGAIAQVLEEVHWNRRLAAKRLNVGYKALLYKIEKYRLKGPGSARDTPPGEDESCPAPPLEDIRRTREQAEREVVVSVLEAAGWNRRRAAAMLNVTYKALLCRMARLGIRRTNISAGRYHRVAS
jgi:two-component system response regulator AtoC